MEWIVAVVVVAVIAVAVTTFAIKQVRYRRAPSEHRDGTDTLASLVGVVSEPSAVELLQIVERLRSKGALWPEIFEAVNPRQDATVRQMLLALRGPHMFLPHVGLNLLEDGCRLAIVRSPGSGQVDALREALRSDDIVFKFEK